MQSSSNLVRDSKFARDLITLLGSGRRPVSLARAARETLRIENLDEARLRHIFGQLLANDPRFEISDEGLRLAEDRRAGLALKDLEFVVIDTETTGGAPAHGHRLTEVGAVRVRGGEVLDSYSTLVNPLRPIPPMITRLTGITDAMVARAPTFEQSAPALLRFIGDAVLVAHNAPFDRAFLNAELRRAYGRQIVSPFLCTVRLARRAIPGLSSYSLDSVARHLQLSVCDRHRALGDAKVTADLLCHILDEIGSHSMRDLAAPRRRRVAFVR